MNKQLIVPLAALFFFCTGFGPGPKPTGSRLLLNFRHQVDNRPLQLNDSLNSYTNAHGDDYYVTTFKYYLSNITLIKTNGDTVRIPESYLLVNAADSSTFLQALEDVPPGRYRSISFIIGVDSLRNFAGAQTGSLDPAKGMFWTWKSGYIFVKMEGVSSQSTSRKNRLTFHIGGAIDPDNTIRNFSQPLPRKLKLKAGASPRLDIAVNVAALFRGATNVSFAELNHTMGGPKSVVIADNYAKGLFTITGIKK